MFGGRPRWQRPAPVVSALALAALALAPGPPAGADTAPAGTASAQPNKAGQPSKIVIDAHGSAGGVGQSVPQGVTVRVYRGFQLDLAAADRCTSAQFQSFTCPASSQVSSGTFSGTYSYATFQGSFSGTIEAFLGPTENGDLADVFVEVDVGGGKHGATGQLVTESDPTYGYDLRFDPLPPASVPPGASVTVNQLTVTTGRSRTVSTPSAAKPGARSRSKRRRACRRHHRRCRGRSRGQAAATVTHNLITNPATCTGSWPLELRVRYSDHTDVRDAAIACTP